MILSLSLLLALIASAALLSLTALLGRGQWIILPLGVFAGLMLLSFFLQPLS